MNSAVSKFVAHFLFSFLVSAAMVVLDMLYHISTETAVHVNYVAVKFSLIFLILFLTTVWTKKGFNEAVFACVSGPVIFYIYYIYADPTLNRALFTIDDSFGYIFLHIAAFLIAYWLVFTIFDRARTSSKSYSRELIIAGKAMLGALLVYAFDAVYQMQKVQLTTKNEELVAQVLHVDTSLYLILLVFILGFLCFYYVQNIVLRGVLFTIASVGGILLLGSDVVRAAVGIIAGAVPFILLWYYEQILQKKSLAKKGKERLIYFGITALIAGVIGIIYTFGSYELIKKTLHIGFVLQHNDHVMIGTIGLTIAVAALYAVLQKK